MKLQILILLLLMLQSCSKNSKEKVEITGKPLEIKPLEISDVFSQKTISDFFDLKKIIPLKGLKGDDLISSIDKVSFHDNFFYVLDRNFSKLYVFDSNGNFHHKVGDLGESPGHYQNINDFEIDTINKKVLVYSNDSMSIFEYDLSGKFLSKIKLSFFAYSMGRISQNQLIFYANFNKTKERNNLYLTNNLGEIEKQYFPYGKKQYSGIAFSGFLSPTSNKYEFNFSIGLSDTVYSITNTKISAKYYFNFDEGKKNKEIRLNHHMFFDKGLGLDDSFLRNNFIENKSICFYNYQHQRVINNGFLFKKSLLTFHFNKVTDRDFLEKILSHPLATDDSDNFISYFDSELIKTFSEENPNLYLDFKKKYPNIYESIQFNKENLLPMLVIYSLQMPHPN